MTSATLSKTSSAFLSAFDGAVDEFVTTGRKFDVKQMMNQAKLKVADIAEVQAKLKNKVDELELVVVDANDQLIEGYSNLTKAQQRELLSFYHTIMEQKSTITRKRKESKIDEDGVIRDDGTPRVARAKKESKKEPKVVEAPTVVGIYTAVYATIPKYRVIRVFKDAQEMSNGKVTFTEAKEIRFDKDVDLNQIESMTNQTEVEDFIASKGKEHSYVPNTWIAKVVEKVVKF